MQRKLRTLKEGNLKNKYVLLRVDFNVPIDEENGKVHDDTRIREALPTIKYLIKEGAKLVIISHLGRPKGKIEHKLKLDQVSMVLKKLIKQEVKKVDETIGKKVSAVVAKMKPGSVVMLENVRFNQGEEENEQNFTKKLAALGEVFVNDAFSVSHRDQASVTGIPKFLPSFAGFLLEKEVEMLSKGLFAAKKPITLILGGAKIDTKIDILKNFIGKADYFLIGGGLANTFLAACGYFVGNSLYEANKVEIAQEIMLMAERDQEVFILPKDVIVASEINNNSEILTIPIQDIEGDMRIIDIGPMTRTRFHQIILKSQMIIWNGPMGMHEYEPFRAGTAMVAKDVSTCKAFTIIGGGDTIDAIKTSKVDLKKFDHVSTGGGAMIEFLAGKKLPGLECLYER